MFDQHQRRWGDVVQILYKCFVFTGKMLGRRCTNIIQMFCVYWEVGENVRKYDNPISELYIPQEMDLLRCRQRKIQLTLFPIELGNC